MVTMMLTAQVFPFLMKLSTAPRVIVYDPGDSRITAELNESDRYRLVEADSRDELDAILVEMNSQVLGLVVPADFDQVLDSGAGLELDGYVVWSARSAASELGSELAEHLSELLGEPVGILVEGNIVYPPPEGTGHLGMIAIVLVMVLAITGGFMVPYLIFEEKQTHTMEALLVSPANVGQILVGKAVAGLFYCLTAIAVALAFNHSTITHWGVSILAAVCGGLLAIAIGLVLGSTFESTQQMGLWAGIPLLLLMVPVMVVSMGMRLPGSLESLFPWLPTVALADLFLLSFSGGATMSRALPDMALVVGWAVPIYLLAVWIVRRLDR
jgi:ABC-2 type transport system permease protein